MDRDRAPTPALVFAGVTIGVTVTDAATKIVAVSLWSTGSARLGPVEVGVVRNPGAAFGFGAGSTAWVTAAGLAVLVLLGHQAKVAGRGRVVAFGLLAGGAIGNLADRFTRAPGFMHGAVVDWIRVAPYPATFNAADVALRTGAALLLIGWWRERRRSADAIDLVDRVVEARTDQRAE